MEPEVSQIKDDINDLKVNVGILTHDFTELKTTLTTAVDKISNSMSTLATITEKLSQNVQDHQAIHSRIDDLISLQDEKDKELIFCKERLIDIQRTLSMLEEQRRTEDENKKNSTFNKAKEKVLEYVFLIITALTVFILLKHFSDFITFMNGQSLIQSPTQIGR